MSEMEYYVDGMGLSQRKKREKPKPVRKERIISEVIDEKPKDKKEK